PQRQRVGGAGLGGADAIGQGRPGARGGVIVLRRGGGQGRLAQRVLAGGRIAGLSPEACAREQRPPGPRGEAGGGRACPAAGEGGGGGGGREVAAAGARLDRVEAIADRGDAGAGRGIVGQRHRRRQRLLVAAVGDRRQAAGELDRVLEELIARRR